MITEKEYISRIKAEDALASFVDLFTYTHQEDDNKIDEFQKDYLLKVHRMRIDALIKNNEEYEKYTQLRDIFVDEYHHPHLVLSDVMPWILLFGAVFTFLFAMVMLRFAG